LKLLPATCKQNAKCAKPATKVEKTTTATALRRLALYILFTHKLNFCSLAEISLKRSQDSSEQGRGNQLERLLKD